MMIDVRSLGAAAALVFLALSAEPARAEGYNPYVTVDYLESVTPRKSGDPDRPIVIGTVPNSATRREDRISDWGKSQEHTDLPSPPANGGLTKFGANIGDHLKASPGAGPMRRAGQNPAAPRATFHGSGRNLMNSHR